MPEGHLLHRAAREHTEALAGQALRVTSPQGKLDPGPVDGRVLERVWAHGKHLFDCFEGGLAVHVHLGMRGLFLRYDDPAVPPRGGVRLRLAGTVAFDLIAPTTCELLDAAGVARVVAGLGPDPLAPDALALQDEAVRRLRSSRLPLAAAVLDQAVWSGVGNAWRAELLYVARLPPALPASAVDEEAAGRLWQLTVALMELGRDAGQVVSDPAAPDERWVYKRDTCRGCGAPVQVEKVGGRTSYACPVEQAG